MNRIGAVCQFVLSLPLGATLLAGGVANGDSFPSQWTWTSGSNLLQGLGEIRGAVLDGKFYVVGGRTGHGSGHTCVNRVQVYDPGTDAWSDAAPLLDSLCGIGLVSYGGYLYSFGGNYEPVWWGRVRNATYRYDPNSNTWATMAPMPIARSNFATAVIGGKIYCAGGNVHWPSATSRVDAYDPACDTWSTIANMPEARGDAVGGDYQGDLVVAYGLSDAYTPRRQTYRHDMPNGPWTQPCTVIELFGTQGMFLSSDDNGMYFGGSRENHAYQTWISRFHPETGTVDWLSQAPAARGCAAAAYDPVHSVIYAAGGDNSQGGNLTILEIGRPVVLGDMNCDGTLDFDDINPFILAITDHAQYEQQYPNCNWLSADCNGDGYVDFGDINPFIALLGGN